MNVKKFSEATSGSVNRRVDHYLDTNKKHSWIKWSAVVACVCIIVVVIFSALKGNNVVKIYRLNQSEYMEVELVEWQDEGFRAIVTATGNNNIFPVEAELTVIFEEETRIVLSDGTLFGYNSEEPKAGLVRWESGSTIRVEFLNYQQYSEDNGFRNHVYAAIVEQI
ncbi:MAG: hypothetical protein GX800_08765 [Clostridiaceae bacterium]|nr:hypothetical protein [Clostridiaceae bacterium]